MMKILCGAALLSLLWIQQALAWGPEGHSIVAQIAQRRLTPCGGDQGHPQSDVGSPGLHAASLDSFASWADDNRAPGTAHPESFDWHFVDIPLGPAGTDNTFDATRD
jgi:hypothetical protein